MRDWVEPLDAAAAPAYVVLSAQGPAHERHFTCAALVDGEQFGVGEGKSKKAAEQEAARETLAKLL